MKEISYVVNNTLGIHARPAALLAQCCVNFKSQVRIHLGDKVADGDNVLQILALGAKKGDTLRVDIDGDDEEVAAKAIEELLHGAFEEKKPVDVLKIAFFGTKDYDRTFFSELVKDKGQGTYNSDIKYFDSQLGPETAGLAQGYDAVCIFVNDNASRPVVEKLHECGVKLILLRCAGFSNHKPWLKMTGSQDKINVESQFNDPNSIYSFYKKMISIRKQEDILVYGDFEEVNTVDDVIGYKRTYQGQEIICLCNFTNTEQPIPDIQGNILLDNYNNYNPTTLKPYQFVMIKK